jgi:hypothetical protein
MFPYSLHILEPVTQTITLYANIEIPEGEYRLKIRAISGSVFDEEELDVRIIPPTIEDGTATQPYFDISDPNPANLTIGKGDEGYFLVQITPQNGFYGDVFFDVLSGASVITWLTLNPKRSEFMVA